MAIMGIGYAGGHGLTHSVNGQCLLASMSTPAKLNIELAFKSFAGRKVLQGAGLCLVQGQITGLLGSNGSGKSTMLQMLFGNLRGGDKVVSANGKRLSGPAYCLPGLVNYLPQYTILPSGKSMRSLCSLFRISIEELLRYFPELSEELESFVHQLSGGRQRLWQALLLLLAPTSFTLLDEPFTHLSPLQVEQLKPLLSDLRKRKGLLLTDHMYAPLLELAQEIWFIKSGQSFILRDRSDLVLHGYVATLEST